MAARQEGAWSRQWDARYRAWYFFRSSPGSGLVETTWVTPPEWRGADARPPDADDAPRSADRLSRIAGSAAGAAEKDSLYAKDTDLQESEEVDPRVEGALEAMNLAMSRVNDAEAALVAARRRHASAEVEQARTCQAAYEKLSKKARELVPAAQRQLQAQQQQETVQCALAEYRRAHDAHCAAKEAVSAAERKLLAASGQSEVNTRLLSECSDLASRVVEAESRKARAEKAHAAEARKLSACLSELRAGAPKGLKPEQVMERLQPFLRVKSQSEAVLAAEARRVRELEQTLEGWKGAYSDALRLLDAISRDVHAQRVAAAEAAAAAAAAVQVAATEAAAAEAVQAAVAEAAAEAAAEVAAEAPPAEAAAVEAGTAAEATPADAESSPKQKEEGDERVVVS
jgi:SH3 domain-binding protein 5 (SH3BP5)